VLLADVVKDYSRTVMMTVEPSKRIPRGVEKEFIALERQAKGDLRDEGFAPSQIRLSRALALRYRGQSFELEIETGVELNGSDGPHEPDGGVIARFHQAHRERYGHADQNRAVEIVSVRLRGVGVTEKNRLRPARSFARYLPKPQRKAYVWFGEKRKQVPVYDRADLRPGAAILGPAIIIEYGSTTLAPEGWKVKVDRWKNLALDSVAAVT